MCAMATTSPSTSATRTMRASSSSATRCISSRFDARVPPRDIPAFIAWACSSASRGASPGRAGRTATCLPSTSSALRRPRRRTPAPTDSGLPPPRSNLLGRPCLPQERRRLSPRDRSRAARGRWWARACQHCPSRRSCSRLRLLHLLVERAENLGHLLVDDRLEHTLPHRSDGAEDVDVRFPVHFRPAVGLAQAERGVHVHDRPDAVPFRVQLGELGLALLHLLEVDRHAQAAEPERDLDVRTPVPVVLDVERLDTRHRLGHLRRIVQDAPDRRPRCVELSLAGDLHRLSTLTSLRVSAGFCRNSQTCWYRLQLRQTIGPSPRLPRAFCSAAQTAWIPAPPPSPIPFAPSGVNGDSDSMKPFFSGGMSSACGTW